MFAIPPEAGEPDFIALFDYWCRQAPPGRLPGRQHLDPLDLPRDMLPLLMLFDVEGAFDGAQFRARLAGTKVVQVLGREPRGLLLQQLGLTEAGNLTSTFRAAVTLAAPVVYSAPLTLPSGRQIWARRFALPLAGDGVTVDKVLGIYALRDAPMAGASGLAVFERLKPQWRLRSAG